MDNIKVSSRLDIIDALRGLSLLGIAISHNITQFYGMLPTSQQNILIFNNLDILLNSIAGLFLVGKSFMIFSFLFGLSFSFQFNEQKNIRNIKVRFVWRLLLLSFIGLLHFSIYQGDILITYSILGLCLILLDQLSSKIILLIVLLLFSGLPRFATLKYFKIKEISPSVVKEFDANSLSRSSFKVNQTGSLPQVIMHNVKHWKSIFKIFQIGLFGRGYQSLALFLLGLLAGRINYFRQLSKYKRKTILLRNYSLILSIIFAIGIAIIYLKYRNIDMNTWSTMVGITFYDLFNLSFSSFITCSFVLVFQHNKEHRIITSLSSVGRMGLTNYIALSLFFTWLYFGWGLHLFGSISVTTSIFLGLLFFMIQVKVSQLWLQKFSYGPIEWPWRCATYFKFFPLIKSNKGYT